MLGWERQNGAWVEMKRFSSLQSCLQVLVSILAFHPSSRQKGAFSHSTMDMGLYH